MDINNIILCSQCLNNYLLFYLLTVLLKSQIFWGISFLLEIHTLDPLTVDLLTGSCLNPYLSVNVFIIFYSSWKITFAGPQFRITSFSLNTYKILWHSLLVPTVAVEKSVVSLPFFFSGVLFFWLFWRSFFDCCITLRAFHHCCSLNVSLYSFLVLLHECSIFFCHSEDIK